jgi:hypothetical protein
VVAKVRERYAVRKQAAQKFHGERFNLRKLNELKCMKQYQIEITNWFAALENLNDGKHITRAWENIKENIRTSAKESLGLCELNKQEPWLCKECLRLLDQRKQAKMHWLQDPKQSNVDNINKVRRETSRHFRNKNK